MCIAHRESARKFRGRSPTRPRQTQMHINPYATYCHSPLQYHYTRRAAIVEKREHMFLRAMSKAMRYYRIWIYSCNVALFIGTLIYTIAFMSIIGDSTLYFFPNIRLYQPTFIYSYFAIIVQGGLLQTIGCIGALKLNERYLNTYLIAICVLLFGDGILGIVWILRYNHIVTNLRTDLRMQIAKDYSTDSTLEELWNELQSNYRCCGVDGPNDYNQSQWLNYTRRQWQSTIAPMDQLDSDSSLTSQTSMEWILPRSCCLTESVTDSQPVCVARIDEEHVFKRGCYEHIYHWLQSSVDLLSVLGFCVITFIKMCFLCLLRYEIKEMIEKIQVIKGQTAASNTAAHMLPFQDLEAYLPRPSMQQDSLLMGNATTTGLSSSIGGGMGAQFNRSTTPHNTIATEKCHCRIGMTNLTSTLSGSRMILSTSTANLSMGCQSKKHSLV